MSGKTIIATGADGQLGRHLRLSCAGSADRWIFVGRDDLDITDPRAIARLMDDTEASAVVNCAAYTDVEGAESHRDYAMSVNGTAPGYLAEACRERGAFLVHISTDYVFDGMSCRPYAEDHPTSPVNAYGVAKLPANGPWRRADAGMSCYVPRGYTPCSAGTSLKPCWSVLPDAIVWRWCTIRWGAPRMPATCRRPYSA